MEGHICIYIKKRTDIRHVYQSRLKGYNDTPKVLIVTYQPLSSVNIKRIEKEEVRNGTSQSINEG